ncbi:putative polyketide synthase [Hypoxylon rubiginosum]|uniref:Polyketide synthase n=1 Tax=Hypoxylon rubiginosum TaxID=110542 RepID=A0ACB9YN33_9PEZI|nr:putative polyketide synthase [Hypoxylon rubiginosum]
MILQATQHLLLFGDQTVEKLSSIRALVRNSKTSPAAKRFLQEATDVVQLEFSRISREEHGWNQDFDTLLGLAEENSDRETPNGMVATVLMCIGRLGELIVAAEQDPTILGSGQNPVQVLGFCTGLLPASAIIAARDTSELFTLAREIISITFRMAYEIRRRMLLIEDDPSSWAMTYVGLTAEKMEKILDEFHKSQNIPTPRRVSVGVISKGWITLVGAPSSLARLSSWSPELGSAAHVKTDAGGPIHSKNMPRIDIETVLGDSLIRALPLDWSKARMYSPGSCKEYRHATLGPLLGEIIDDVAHNILHAGQLIDTFIGQMDSRVSVKLTVVGPTGHLPAVEQALRKRTIPYSIVDYTQTIKPDVARGGSDLVAIVGMAGRFPGSDTIEGFWEDLQKGKCHIKKVPKDRFDLDVYYDPTGEKKNSTTAQHGAFIDEPGVFDHRLFNVSPREAAQMDPIQRLLLTTSYEALESAGYCPDGTLSTESNRIATYFGQSSDDWHEILNIEGVDIYYVPSLVRAFGPSKLNYHYKWGGASFAVDSACATSTTAISLACSALISRECDTAMAGGGAVYVSPNGFSGLSRAGMLSTTGGCRTYHDDADGYARGEAVAVVVLKRLEDAVADNDNILGVVRGSTRTYSSTSTSITHPSHISQERVYKDVLRQSSLDPEEISYVEMHGTGTQAGDFEEMTSVINVMARHRSKDNPLTVGAVKAAVGHGEAAAGVTSLIKILMMLRDRVVPPQPGWPFQLNHKFPPLDRMNVRIAAKKSELRSSPLGNKKLKVLVNTFDASGGNTSLAIEEPPAQPIKVDDPRATHVIAISARTIASLQKNRERLLDYLTRNSNTKLADLAYSTTARRMHETLRVAYVGKSTNDIVYQLRDDVAKNGANDPRTKVKKTSRVFLFTGQGSQYAGMGAGLFTTNKPFAELLQTYQDMAVEMGLPPYLDIISDKGVDITVQSATKVQLAIVSLEMAVAFMLRTWGIKPDVVIGHSLGEYAALNTAGVLSVSDVLYLVGKRAMLMEKHLAPHTHAMLATSSDVASLQGSFATLGLKSCNIACINAPSVTVASGSVQDISVLQERMAADGARTTLLKVPYGFHSAQTEPILNEFRNLARGVVFSKPVIPIVSTLTGEIEREAATFSPTYLARQARESVNFVGALNTCKAAGFVGENTLFVEIGPDPVCMGLARRTLELPPSTRFLPTLKSNEDNWATISGVLKAAYETGVSVNWPEFHKTYKSSVKLLELPHYAFDNRVFWTSYVEPIPVAQDADVTSVKTIEAPRLAGFPTTSVHRVVSEEATDASVTVTFSSDTSAPGLLKAIQNHIVNGQKICPLSTLGDMALTAAQYTFFKLHNTETPIDRMSIHDMEMVKAFVLVDGTPYPTIYVTATYVAEKGTVDITFHSKPGGKDVIHGICKVQFGDSVPWQNSLSRTLFLLKSRIETLQERGNTGKAHKLLAPIVYKLFSNVVIYDEAYRGLEEVVLASDCSDAVGRVTLPTTEGTGHFLFDPYGVESVTHLAGFVLNSGLKYSDDIACVTFGFDSWRALEPLSHGTIYTNYVCMQEIPGSPIISADCYVFNGDKLVQVTSGFKFQKINKVALNTVLGIPSVASPTGRADQHTRHAKTVKRSQIDSGFVSQISSALETPMAMSDIGTPETDSLTEASGGADIVAMLLSTVAHESGCTPNDMVDDAMFTDLGVDSLMAITVFAIVKRETGLDLEASFFVENATIGEAKRAILNRVGGPQDNLPVTPPPEVSEVKVKFVAPVQVIEAPVTPPEDIIVEEKIHDVIEVKKTKSNSETVVKVTAVEVSESVSPATTAVEVPTQYTSKVIHLQGKRTPEADKLFLIADETGSALSYIQLPDLDPSLCVYGVESPFSKSPSDYTVSIPQLAGVFAAAIRKEQAAGPYLLGGMSAGATVAYEVARQLLAAGEQVRGLLLLDPTKTADIELRLTAPPKGVGLKPAQKEHIRRTLAALAAYRPSTMATAGSAGQPRKVVAIVTKQTADAQTVWEKRVPGLVCTPIDAATGTLMKFPTLNVFGQMCKEAVATILE